jgi:hypothetical protein
MKGLLLASPEPTTNLGFLSVFRDGAGWAGGYLVTNAWGRPLEFRLSSAVQPTKVQQILYGETLHGYLCGEVIGKTLVEKTTTPVQWVVVDSSSALDLRLHLSTPVGLWRPGTDADEPWPGLVIQTGLFAHPSFPEDVDTLRGHVEKLGPFDFGEPFARIREAMGEARKLGVARAA